MVHFIIKRYLPLLALLLFSFAGVYAQATGPLPKLIPYRKGNQWGYADSLKNIVVLPQFDQPVFLYHNTIVSINHKMGMLDSAGGVLIPCEFDEVSQLYDKEIIIYARRGKQYFKFIEESRKLIPFNYPTLKDEADEQLEEIIEGQAYYPPDSNITIRTPSKRIYQVLVTKVIPYSDGTSKFLRIDSVTFVADKIRSIPMTDSLFFVRENKKWGIISFSKKTILPAVYDSIYAIFGGYAFAVQIGKKRGIILLSNSLASPLAYDDIQNNDDSDGFLVKQNKRWGVLLEDLETGIMIGPERFKKYSVFPGLGLIGLTRTDGKFLGYVDFRGTRYWD